MVLSIHFLMSEFDNQILSILLIFCGGINWNTIVSPGWGYGAGLLLTVLLSTM